MPAEQGECLSEGLADISSTPLSDIGISAQIKLLLIDCRKNLYNDMMPSILLPVI